MRAKTVECYKIALKIRHFGMEYRKKNKQIRIAIKSRMW